MAQDTRDEQFDIACLKEIATDPASRRLALAAALIKLHALAIARTVPEKRDEAMEIVGYSRQLFRTLPTRDSIGTIVDRCVGQDGRAGRRNRDRLVDMLWEHLQAGRA